MTDTPGQQRCTLCDCGRIPLDREKTRFGACTNIQCEDPTLDYRNEQSTLPELLEKARHHVMTDEEKEAQRQSWVRGEMALDRDGQTRVMREVGGAQPEPDRAMDVAAYKQSQAERHAAEDAYTISAFDYQRDPVGSRDWELFWKGWQARAGSSPAPSPQDCRDDGQLAEQLAPLLWEADDWWDKTRDELTPNADWAECIWLCMLPRVRAILAGVTGNEGKDGGPNV